jgi:nucleoside-diphosphate-sugar epimerase
VVFTSTQFVHQYHGFPKDDQDYAPHTVYGESKVLMEKMIREANLNVVWTIIRPTNIWGPWHLRYPFEFWRVLSKGLYVHPGRQPVTRSYGYVGNVVSQIISIIESVAEKVRGKVFYVGDPAIDLYDWVNGFSVLQTGKNVRVVPRLIVRTLAIVGDIFAIANVGFPITSSRYKSMTTSNIAPMERTLEAFGTPPYSLDQGIQETVEWMKTVHPELVKVRKL